MVTYPVPDLRDRGCCEFFEHGGRPGAFGAISTWTRRWMPASRRCALIAETVLETGFSAPVVVGHCCSLSTQDEARAMDTLDLVAQGRARRGQPADVQPLPAGPPRRTARRAAAASRWSTRCGRAASRVSFASDNTRDPFYAYGDMDMLEVMREATRIGHLDHSGDRLAACLHRPPRGHLRLRRAVALRRARPPIW